jgi:hypothetical protein
LNLARFDQIKKQTNDLDRSHVRDLDLAGIGEIFEMLQECITELEVRFKPTPVRTSGPRAVVLDAQGKPVLPPPMVVQFEGERRDQYALDRHMAVMSLDPEQWRVFSLRWGLTPPPGGWENVEAITNVMHAVRLGVRSVPYLDKHFSAVHLTSRGIKLPPGMQLVGGVLHGHDTDESLPT